MPTPDPVMAAAPFSHARTTGELFSVFQPLVRRVLRRYRHLRCAEDLPGEAFLAFEHLVAEYDPGRGIPFPSYLSRMLPATLHTVVRRYCRAYSREVPFPDPDGGGLGDDAGRGMAERASRASARASGGDILEQLVVGDLVRALLAELSPHQAYVFEQRALQGRDYAQIATSTGSSTGAVRVAYHSARLRLQDRWSALAHPSLTTADR
jgi:RNA polymerase sigma factor (sigma-70 family)